MATVKRTKTLPLLALPILDEHEVYAIKALNKGEATPEQQIKSIDVILKKFCRINQLSYVEGDQSARDFNEGRKKVGFDLLTIITEPTQKLITKEKV